MNRRYITPCPSVFTVAIAFISLSAIALAQTDPRQLPRRLPGPGWSGGVRTPQMPTADYTPRASANQGIGSGDRSLGSANQGIGIGARELGAADQGLGTSPTFSSPNQVFAPDAQGPNFSNGAAFFVDPATGRLFLEMQPTFQQPTAQQPTAGVPSRLGFSTQGARRNAYTPLNPATPNVQQNGFGDASGATGSVTLRSAFGDIQRGSTLRQPIGNLGLMFDTAAVGVLRVDRVAYLDNRVAAGDSPRITLVRDGREIDVVASSRLASDDRRLDRPRRSRPRTGSSRGAALGVTFDNRAVNFVHVWRVAPDSPADQAGLRHGDDIVSINGQHMMSYKDVLEYLATRSPGDEIDLAILRNGRQLFLQTTLGTADEAFAAERPVPRRRI
jgi:hypothetical protein